MEENRTEGWDSHAMARTHVSTTVDHALVLAQHCRAEVDRAYAAYDEHPLDEPDEWGDLASFLQGHR